RRVRSDAVRTHWHANVAARNPANRWTRRVARKHRWPVVCCDSPVIRWIGSIPVLRELSFLRLLRLTLCIVACLLYAGVAAAVTVPSLFVDEELAPGVVFNAPTAIAYLPGGRLLVCEKAGHVYALNNGVKSAQPLWNHENEVLNDGDRGLLGIAVDPNYVTNHYIYLLYTVDPDSDGVDTSPQD